MRKQFLGMAASVLFAASPLTAVQNITVKGSDTMVILNQRWAETYMGAHKEAVVQVTGGGSGTGISALLSGSTDICASSRPMSDKEKTDLTAKGGTAIEIPVAKDGVAIYVNSKNPVKELTMAQIKDIYTGKITNWKDVGGADGRIILYSRENNSGTYVFFKEHMLNKQDFSPMAQSLPGTSAVVNAVSRDPKSIGYGGAAYAKGIRFVAVKADNQSPAYLPDESHILSGKYAASRNLFFYLRAPAAGDLKKFIDWVLSPEGQGVVSSVGYFPLKKAASKK
ncbi:MAG: phosphate ABC transporter substrate-binding protein [Elusimicrobia bacterium]|nr:phosphate ABC transporter substrate-binding protein [Elusimicrobiota bacterium]